MIGFLVNPIAGMGGRVGLKGTDGEAYFEALRRGAKPVAPERAARFLIRLEKLPLDEEILSPPGVMGENYLHSRRLRYRIVGSLEKRVTTAEDTRRFSRMMADMGVSIMVFVGGDGTARDIVSAIDAEIPMLGVPSGVKMYSGVFAVNPEAAARLLYEYLRGNAELVDAEVLDIDEEAFRRGRLSIRLYGYARTPMITGLLQGSKQPSLLGEEDENKRAIARYFAERYYKQCTLYLLGPGTTVKAIADELGVEKTLLGVDAVYNGRLVGRDLDEKGMLSLLDKYSRAVIVVSPIGGQGFIFGRGNQQISPRVIRRVGLDNIIIVATRHKISRLDSLKVDTGDPSLDEEFRGYIRVIVDYMEEQVMRVT